jgi:hypothetical protein
MWKAIRIVVLLFILATVAQGAWLARVDATDWKNPVIVVLYPINADGSQRSEQYLARMDLSRFQPMAEFMREQALVYGIQEKEPIELRLAPRVQRVPPQPPAPGNVAAAIWWSLNFRFWAWRHDTYTGARAHVRLFLMYHDDRKSPRLPHSTGLEKGLIGLVNVFANEEMTSANNVIIVHEMLHTLGATDKYDRATNMPLFPDGYAEPQRMPLLPQLYAEIMGGRIPIGSLRADQPDGLHQALIGPLTAREINWIAR